MLTLATEATNLAVFGYLGGSVVTSFIGGFEGNLLGEILTSGIDSGFTFSNFDLGRALCRSTVLGSLNIIAGIFSGLTVILGKVAEVAENANTLLACNVLSLSIASATEAVYDFLSYIINSLLGDA